MLKRRCKALLSLVLVLSIIMIGVSYADSVYVSGAPTNNGSIMSQAGAYDPQQQATNYLTGQGVYPGSIGNVNDAPTSNNISSPAANNAKKSASYNGGTSNVITNGYTWGAEQDYREPVARDILSPGAHQAEMNSRINGISATTDMGYVAPNGTTQDTSSSNSGYSDFAFQYPSAGYTTPSQNIDYGQFNTGVTTTQGFNMHNVGIPDPVINSDGAVVVNATTRDMYYAKNPTKTYAPAGLTTLLTGYILLQQRGLDDVLAVTQSAVTGLESGANTVGLRAGDTITVRDALYALYIKSACDVAKVIAENIAGSEQAFVNMMNQTAASWGCTSTHFENSTGLNNAAQVTTPYDMAIIMSNVVQVATLNQIMQTPAYTLPATAHRKAMGITTKNEFINPSKSNYYPGIVSSRMGYTSKAKYTMAAFMIHNNQYLISIVLYSNNTQFVDSKRLLNFGRTAVDRLGLTQAGTYTNTASFTTANTIQTTQASQNVVINSMQSGSMSGDTIGLWQEDGKGWYFLKDNTTKAMNEWIQTNGKKYCVDSDGYMITGWREFSNGAIYYFNPSSGELRANTWINTTTGAYYLQADGTLARADRGQTKTISTQVGNYVIDENGKAIQKIQ